MKTDLFQIISTSLDNITHEKSFIHSKIDSWIEEVDNSRKSTNQKKQKLKELVDLGKFIYLFDQTIEVRDGLCERPDFIVSYGNSMVGVELTDLVLRSEEKEEEGVLKKMFEKIRSDLSSDLDRYKGIYRVDLESGIDLSSDGRKILEAEIRNIIDGKCIDGTMVQGVHHLPFNDIHLYKSEAHVVGSLSRSIIESNVVNKEKSIPDRPNSFSEIWLVLVVGGLQTSGDYSFIESEVTDFPFQTMFDRIFLMNFFQSEVVELNLKKSE